MWIVRGLFGSDEPSKDTGDDTHGKGSVVGALQEGLEEEDSSPFAGRLGEATEKGLALEGAFYRVSGQNFECLFKHCSVEVVEHHDSTAKLVLTELYDDDEEENHNGKESNRNGRFEIPLQFMSNFQQHLSDAFQFLVKRKKDNAEEFGLQLDTELMASVLRRTVEPLFSSTASVLICVPCAFAWYDTSRRSFVPISRTCQVAIAQRPVDLEAFLIVREETASPPSTSSEILFQDVLSPAMNLWTVPNVSQVVFWGPAPKHADSGGQRSMFMVELLLQEEDPDNVSFFQLLAIVLKERIAAAKLTSAQKKSVEDVVSAKLAEAGDGGRRRRDEAEDGRREFDYDDQEMVSFDGLSEENSQSSDGIFDTQVTSESDGQVCWRSSGGYSEKEENDRTDDEDYEGDITPVPVMSRDPTRGITREDRSALLHKFMEVGTERTFVCRGTEQSGGYQTHGGGRRDVEVQLYKPTGDSRHPLSNAGIISGNKFCFQDDQIYPTKGILHDGEKKLLLTSDSQPTDVYMMDLERESVVHKWETDYQKVNGMLPTFKFGQSSHDPTFLCHNEKNLFLMDTRLNGNARTTSVSYASNPHFSTAATDEGGHLLVGSRLGTLRLYDGGQNRDGNFKRAKTQLETVREPLVAVDVNCDGSWIIGTTREYLVVFPTRLASSGKTGFETSLGKHKPQPRYLRLRASDIQKYGLTDINFTPAKFSSDESSIVSSTGNLAVIWDMRSIQKGKPVYTIKIASNYIKDVQVPAEDSSVVVAYPQDVGLFGTGRKSHGG